MPARLPAHPHRHRHAGAAITWLLAVVAFAIPTRAHGQAAAGPEADAAQPMAAVTLDGETLFRVRGVTAFPAEARAKAIGDRIHAFAATDTLPVEALRIVEDAGHLRLVVGNETLVNVYAVDAEIEGVGLETLTKAIRDRIATAVVTYRLDRRPAIVLRRSAYAVVATFVLVLGCIAIGRGLRRLEAVIASRYKSRLQNLRIQTFQLIHPERLWAVLLVGLRLLRVAVLVALVLAYAEFVLSLFPWTRPLAERGGALLVGPLRVMGQSLVAAVPGLVFIVVLVVVTRYLLRMMRLFFDGIAKETLHFSGFDPDWALPTYRICRILVVAFAIVVAYPYIPGSNSAAFKGMSVFLGVIFSLGSSSLISNMIAGYTMTYRRAFKVGDRVRIGDVTGLVTDTRVFVTQVRTPKNESVVIPNSTILQSHVINYSTLARTEGLVLHTTVGIGYETPWRQVEGMLLLAAARTPGLLQQPPPFVLQLGLGDFCVTYEINAYCDQPENILRLYTALHQNILDVFNEYGVQIMTPAYEGDPEQPKLVPRDKWFEQPARPPAP